MRKLLVAFLAIVMFDSMALGAFGSRGGFGGGGGRGFSAPSRSFSAPSRSYSAPRTYTAPPRSVTSPPRSYSSGAAAAASSSHTTIIDNGGGRGSGGGFWHGAILGGLLGRATAPDPAGMVCSGGGCSARSCVPVNPVAPTPPPQILPQAQP